MRGALIQSLLELGHATSQNLAFAHGPRVHVSFGEETITETNLLELVRRHPAPIRLETFSKVKESQIGADWEWQVIGRARRLIMRVQAKRVQRNGVLKIPHVVKKSGKEQIELLIEDAKAKKFKPVYCFYAPETQRSHWKRSSPSGSVEEFEYGCLLACAHKVKAISPKSLSDIEKVSVPWHFLVDRWRYSRFQQNEFFTDEIGLSFLRSVSWTTLASPEAGQDEADANTDFPTIDELNQSQRPARDMEGVFEQPATAVAEPVNAAEYQERGIRLLLQLDVSSIPQRPRPERSTKDRGA